MTFKEIYTVAIISPSFEGFMANLAKLGVSGEPTFELPFEALEQSFEQILAVVSLASGISHEMLKSRSKKAKLVFARNAFYALALERIEGADKSNVGRFVGRDHATVIHALKCVHYKEVQYIIKNCKKLLDEK